MRPRIEILTDKKLVGRMMKMSSAHNKTFELWNGFMKNRNKIKNVIGTNLYSIQIYNPFVDFKNYNPHSEFSMWAAIEVSDWVAIPPGLESYTLKGGLYAVFIHRGLSGDFQKTIQIIFGQWLPDSPYDLDDRPHFQIMGEKYKHNDIDSEEEVWIPVRKMD